MQPIPKHVHEPPFNIVRSSYLTLGVTDLARSRAFYEGTLGLHVEDRTADAIYLRGDEERQHHSLVLKKESEPAAHALGLKIASAVDLAREAHFLKSKDIAHATI